MSRESGYLGGNGNRSVSRRRLLQTSAVGLATISAGTGVVSAGNSGDSSDDVTYFEFAEATDQTVSTGPTLGTAAGRPGVIWSKTYSYDPSFHYSTAETFTVPIRLQDVTGYGSYEIRFDWQLEGERDDNVNMTARANLYRGPEPTKQASVQSEVLSSASAASPSFQRSGTVQFETHIAQDVETVVGMELMLSAPGQLQETEADFHMWVPEPECEEEEHDGSDGESDGDDEECDLPRSVEVRRV